MKQTKKKTNKGITLVALVVTIIILLILAGITINALTDNGLFGKTKEAKEKYSRAEAMEKIQLEVLESYDNNGNLNLEKLTDNIAKNIDGATIEGSEFPITVTVGGEKFIVNESGKVSYSGKGSTGGSDPVVPEDPTPPVEDLISELNENLREKLKEEVKKIKNLDITKTNPMKAMPSETEEIIDGNTKNGIVIKDSKGNEWVWIEVPFTVTKNVTADGDIETALQGYAADYRKSGYTDEWYDGSGKTESTTTNENDTSGCGLTCSKYNENKSKMLQSIKANGGFWIGRYEAGIENSNTNTSLARTSHTAITTESAKAVSKPDHIPYNYVYCSEAQILADKMYEGTDKTSSLMFGIQWDLVCKFLEANVNWGTTNTAQYYIKENSTDWGNYKNKELSITSTNAKQSTDYGETWSSIAGTKGASSILLSTGASTDTRKMNIYDFAGNENEWTLEKEGIDFAPCMSRGGDCCETGSFRPVLCFNHYGSTMSDGENSFRSTLY